MPKPKKLVVGSPKPYTGNPNPTLNPFHVGSVCCTPGIAESLVEFAKAKEVDAVVVGSRGLGSIKRSLMSLVGLGSVSDYCIHQLHVPVLVVRGDGSSSTATTAAEVRGGEIQGGGDALVIVVMLVVVLVVRGDGSSSTATTAAEVRKGVVVVVVVVRGDGSSSGGKGRGWVKKLGW